MMHATDVSEKCAFHQVWNSASRSTAIRLFAVLNAAALRVVRDVIDRRLAHLGREECPPAQESIKVPVSGE